MESEMAEEVLFETQYHATCSRSPRRILQDQANRSGRGSVLSHFSLTGLRQLKEKWSGRKFPAPLTKEISPFISYSGDHVAVATSNQITFLHREDNYMNPCGVFIGKDPQSRFVYGAWSEWQGVLGVIDQMNRIFFLKSDGQEIASSSSSALQLSSPIVGLIALDDIEAKASYSRGFCVITSQGSFHHIEVAQDPSLTSQPLKGSQLVPNILCLDYFPRLSLLVLVTAGSSIGSFSLSLWHLTDDIDLEFISNTSQVEGCFAIPLNYDGPFTVPVVAFSPKGGYVATLDLKGRMNIFSLESDPLSLSLKSYGERSESPSSTLENVDDVSWWSDHIAIIRKGSYVNMFNVRDGREVLKEDLQFRSPVLGGITFHEGFAFLLEESDDSSWRLISFSARSISEMYNILISSQRFKDAIDFAECYGLERDEVFKSQWGQSDQGLREINSSLKNIKDKIFVLLECIKKGKTEDSVRALVSYGLLLTDQYKFAGYEDEQDNATWEFRKMRLQLHQRRDRLETFLGLNMGRFSAQDFDNFQSMPLNSSAISLAESGKIGALNLLFKRHPYSLSKHTLEILSAIPETIPVEFYGQLLPGRYPPTIALRDEDWVESEKMTSFLKNLLKVSGNITSLETEAILKSTNPGLLWPQIEEITEWYKKRARDIDNFTGQIENSLSLVNLGLRKGITELEKFREAVSYLHRLVYSADEEAASYTSLANWENLSDYGKFDMMLEGVKSETIIKRLKELALPFMRNLSGTHSSSFLVDWLKEMASDNCMDICFRVIEEGCKDFHGGGFFRDEIEAMEVTVECVYLCSLTDQWSILSSMLSKLPYNSQGPNKTKFDSTDSDGGRHAEGPSVDLVNSMRTRVKIAEGHVEVGRLLAYYQVPKPMSFFLNAQSEEKNIKQLLRLIMSKFARRQPIRSDHDWASMWRDMQSIQEKAFRFIDPEFMLMEFCRGLLKAGKFSLARNYLKGTASTPLSSEKAETLVVQVAREYFFSAPSLSSNEIWKARECLSLIPGSEIAKAELGVIDALTVKLPSLGVTLLPMQYKQVRNPMEVITMAIKTQPSAYLNLDEIIETARLLGLTSEDDTSSIQEAVAREAAVNGDLVLAFDLCYLLAKKNYGPIWDLCAAIARGPDLGSMDTNSRRHLLGFSLSHCDDESISELLHAWSEADLQLRCEKLAALTGSTSKISLHERDEREVDKPLNFAARYLPWLYELTEEESGQTSSMPATSCILSWMADNGMPANDDLMSILAKSVMENSDGNQDDAIGCSVLLNLKDELRGAEIIEERMKKIKGERELNSIMNLGMMYSSIQSASIGSSDPEERRIMLFQKVREEHASLSPGETEDVEKTRSSFWNAWKLKLEEHKQLAHRGRRIEQLIPGVDFSRFLSRDTDYIEAVILSYIDSVKQKKAHILKTAVELADEYGVPKSKVLLRYLGSALVSEEWSNEEILAEVLDYREEVVASAKEVISVISTSVYPNLHGTKKERLSYVYNLLSACCRHLKHLGDQTEGMDADFLKLLEHECRRVSFIEDLDFKNIASLTSLNVDQVNAEVNRHITDSSVTILAEMVKNLAALDPKSQHLMTWQSVYRVNVLNHLVSLEPTSQLRVDFTEVEASYDICRIYIKELSSEDIREMISSYRMLSLSLSDEFSSKSDLLFLLNFWVKLVNDIKEFTGSEDKVDRLLTCLQALTFLVESEEVPVDQGWKIVTLSGKLGFEEISHLFRAAAFSGCSFQIISDMFSQEDISSLYASAVDSILSKVDQDSVDLINLLTSLSETQSVDDDLDMVRRVVWEKLVSFSDDQKMPSEIRVSALQMMEGIRGKGNGNFKPWKLWNSSVFSETQDQEDNFSGTLVALKSTQLFSSISPRTEITPEDMKSLDSAISCFSRLSGFATTEFHVKKLEEILEEWEGFFCKTPEKGSHMESEDWGEGWELTLEEDTDSAPSSVSSLHCCWMLVMSKYVEISKTKCVMELLDRSGSRPHGTLLTEEEGLRLIQMVDERERLVRVKIALLLPYRSLWFQTLNLIEDKGFVDEELLSLSISSGILASIAADSSHERVFAHFCRSVGSLSRSCQEAMARESRGRERKPAFSLFARVLFPLFVSEMVKAGQLLLAGFMVAKWMHAHSGLSLVNAVEVNLRKFLEAQSQRPETLDLGSCKSLSLTVSNLGNRLGDSIRSALSALP